MAIGEQELKASLKATADWYCNSGIMRPIDGSWGIGERVLLTKDNSAVEKVYISFPSWTEHDSYSIIEQRRADCNLEAAFMFLLMSEYLNEEKYRTIAYNLLDYLYRRSGMLIRSGDNAGGWGWSNLCAMAKKFWFDDNAWMCTLQLMIAAISPQWDKEFGMTDWALKLAGMIEKGFIAQFGKEPNPEFIWEGNLNLPHWGSLAIMALARTGQDKYRPTTELYHKFLLSKKDELTTSEYGYALLGACMTNRYFHDAISLQVAEAFAQKILEKSDPETGNIASEHYEAPSGANLADTIYTLNWAVLGLQCVSRLTGKSEYVAAYEKLLGLLLKIQDKTPEAHLFGCWRGMYDMETGNWGGGDRYEGGANSIYSGWTNAPIPWAMLNALKNKSLLDY
ncbi:MAG: hypothetical protein LBM70_00660 [Victivallales bacterium]|jgi:hypothetical protein|nr:hypothetical protein [Victivallales bacterium]